MKKTILGNGVTAGGLLPEGGWQVVDPSISEGKEDQWGNRFIPPEEWRPEKGELVVVSPGFSPSHPLVKKGEEGGVRFFSDLDYCSFPNFSIWITGTNGKTTTTEMVYHLLKNGEWEPGHRAEIGGNIGIPVGSLDPTAPIWVLEVSSFQLYWTSSATPSLLVVLPITQDHLEWHPSFDHYRRAKLSPLSRMGERSVAILPESERELALSLAPRKGGPFLLFYSTPSQLVERFRLPSPTFPPPFDLDETLARLVYKMVSFRQGSLERFKIDPHKVERFPDRWGRLWVDDSKATNVDATLKGLAQFADRKIYLILGGQGKGQDFTPLFQTLSQRKVELILIGESAPQLAQLAERFHLPYFLAYTLEKGVDYIHRRLKEGEVALLSPACASKDQFKSYKERGERFKELVTRLK